MSIRIEAVYEDGVIKPKKPLQGFADHELITITVEKPHLAQKTPEEILALARGAFAGLSPEQEQILHQARLIRLRD